MSTFVHPTAGEKAGPEPTSEYTNPYGHFAPDGTEFQITRPNTPRPWVNIIANPRFGLAVSQTGSGFTWIDNSQLAVITRWNQEFADDASGGLQTISASVVSHFRVPTTDVPLSTTRSLWRASTESEHTILSDIS